MKASGFNVARDEFLSHHEPAADVCGDLPRFGSGEIELVELAARMPVNLKLRGLKRKYILKRAAESLLPKDVVWRKKAGFGAPVRSWLRGALRPMVEDLLSEETVRRRGLFRPEEVRRIIDANLSGREDYNLQVFQLLTLELWQRAFMD